MNWLAVTVVSIGILVWVGRRGRWISKPRKAPMPEEQLTPSEIDVVDEAVRSGDIQKGKWGIRFQKSTRSEILPNFMMRRENLIRQLPSVRRRGNIKSRMVPKPAFQAGSNEFKKTRHF